MNPAGSEPSTRDGAVAVERTGRSAGRRGPRLPATFRGFPKQFWLQWLGILANRLGTFVQPFLMLYLTTARGLSAQRAGTVAAIWGAGVLVGPLLGGWAADRFSRRDTIVGGMGLAAASLGALGFARGYPMLVVTALLAGSTADIYRPASAALIADIIRPEDRKRAYGLIFWAINIGFSVASVLGGYLAAAGYGTLFVLDAGTCLVFAVVMWVFVPPDRRGMSASSKPTNTYISVLRRPLMAALLVLVLVYATVYEQAYVTLPLAVRDSGLSPSVYGSAIAVNGITIVVLQPWISAKLTRFDDYRIMAGAAFLLCVGLSLTGLATTPVEFAATVFVWSLGEACMAGVPQGVVAALAPAESRGRYQGAFTLARSGSALTGPLVGTNIYAALGHAALWDSCLGAGVVLGIGYLSLRRLAHEPTA